MCLSVCSFLQIEVVNTFKSGTSFQGALRRQSSTTSQNQDVTNVSSPSHVSLSNALSSPTSTTAVPTGREWKFSLCWSEMSPHTHTAHSTTTIKHSLLTYCTPQGGVTSRFPFFHGNTHEICVNHLSSEQDMQSLLKIWLMILFEMMNAFLRHCINLKSHILQQFSTDNH